MNRVADHDSDYEGSDSEFHGCDESDTADSDFNPDERTQGGGADHDDDAIEAPVTIDQLEKTLEAEQAGLEVLECLVAEKEHAFKSTKLAFLELGEEFAEARRVRDALCAKARNEASASRPALHFTFLTHCAGYTIVLSRNIGRGWAAGTLSHNCRVC